jgi:hypothetical protein
VNYCRDASQKRTTTRGGNDGKLSRNFRRRRRRSALIKWVTVRRVMCACVCFVCVMSKGLFDRDLSPCPQSFSAFASYVCLVVYVVFESPSKPGDYC